MRSPGLLALLRERRAEAAREHQNRWAADVEEAGRPEPTHWCCIGACANADLAPAFHVKHSKPRKSQETEGQ